MMNPLIISGVIVVLLIIIGIIMYVRAESREARRLREMRESLERVRNLVPIRSSYPSPSSLVVQSSSRENEAPPYSAVETETKLLDKVKVHEDCLGQKSRRRCPSVGPQGLRIPKVRVLGCDFNIYDSVCKAQVNGVQYYRVLGHDEDENVGTTKDSTCFDVDSDYYGENIYNRKVGGPCTTSPSGARVSTPVIGCDGKKYMSECEAWNNGIKKVFKNPSYAPPADPCYGRPDYNATCPAVHSPIRGCDGNMYGNSCRMRAAGILKESNGFVGIEINRDDIVR
jgi:hypothetical protein